MTEQSLPNWFDERIEPWLDGELDGSEAALFEARLAIDPVLEREVSRATQLTSSLADLPSLRAPSSIQRSVLEMTGTGLSLPALPAWGWSLGGACAAALVLLVSVGLQGALTSEISGDEALAIVDAPNAQQLAKARADLALALGYVDQAGDMAARQFGERAGRVTARSLMQPNRHRAVEPSDTI